MDPVTAITTVVTVVTELAKLEPVFVQAWDNLKPFGIALYTKLTGGTISDADLATLEAQLDALHAQLQQPLSAAQPGDPDYVAPTS